MQPTARAVGKQVGHKQAPAGRKSSSHAGFLAPEESLGSDHERKFKKIDDLDDHPYPPWSRGDLRWIALADDPNPRSPAGLVYCPAAT
jgi:hypothetical protein